MVRAPADVLATRAQVRRRGEEVATTTAEAAAVGSALAEAPLLMKGREPALLQHQRQRPRADGVVDATARTVAVDGRLGAPHDATGCETAGRPITKTAPRTRVARARGDAGGGRGRGLALPRAPRCPIAAPAARLSRAPWSHSGDAVAVGAHAIT